MTARCGRYHGESGGVNGKNEATFWVRCRGLPALVPTGRAVPRLVGASRDASRHFADEAGRSRPALAGLPHRDIMTVRRSKGAAVARDVAAVVVFVPIGGG